jgi:hypothetical protein
MKRIAIAVLLVLMSNSPKTDTQPFVKLTPGLWQMTVTYTKMQMAGIPDEKMRSHLGPQPSQKICITKEMSDSDYFSSGFPVLDGCTLSRKLKADGRVFARMSCQNGNRILTSAGTVKPKRMSFDAHLEQAGTDWQKFDVKSDARLIGPCPK